MNLESINKQLALVAGLIFGMVFGAGITRLGSCMETETPIRLEAIQVQQLEEERRGLAEELAERDRDRVVEQWRSETTLRNQEQLFLCDSNPPTPTAAISLLRSYRPYLVGPTACDTVWVITWWNDGASEPEEKLP